jgi:hypothetical protein
VSTDRYCPNCKVAYEPLQEYCLECGTRLPTNRGLTGVLAGGWQRRFPWYPGDWIWPSLFLLAVAVAGAAAAVAARPSNRSGETIVATSDAVAFGPGAAPAAAAAAPLPATLATAPKPTITTGPLPTAPGANTRATTTTTRLPVGLSTWPAKQGGFTNVLESVPVSAGRGAAVNLAQSAKRAGLPTPGVLVSAAYASLHPGYYIVFSGIYTSAADATAALAQARAQGFPNAYTARVTH